MSAGLEAFTVQEWIVATLTNDTTLATLAGSPEILEDRVWDGEYRGAEDLAPWWISFTVQDPIDVKTVGMIQVMSTVRFTAKVVARGRSYAPALPVYQRVHELLEARLNVPTSDGYLLTSSRVSGFQFPEEDQGMQYRHLGGTFEALSQ